jgi:hypothetical protein
LALDVGQVKLTLSQIGFYCKHFGRYGRCIGIDFSGNWRMWLPGCKYSNVWIADVDYGHSSPVLVDLRRVQLLAGGAPFASLVRYLRDSPNSTLPA